MCGIVGFIGKDLGRLERMKSSIAHRGPDDSGSYLDEYVSLGHVRLSILDLSFHAHQPMEYENLVMVYNGEVYNFKEIREELENSGYTFSSRSDSEVVLKAYHRWGKDAVAKFRGMFAFAIYDKRKKKLSLFRDRVGVKPLYYYFDGESFAFSSEVRAFATFMKPSIDKNALAHFFIYGYTPRERSIYTDIFKLEPGHFLDFEIESKNIVIQKYWELPPLSIMQKSQEEMIEELEALLIESFRYRMVSDVPVGVFLSGGVDSSLVSAILQKHYGFIHTFTIGFTESAYSEAGYARAVAKHIGSEHFEKILQVHEAKELLQKFIEIYDEPFGDSSGLPTYLVSKIAKEQGMKVVLSADGGDELFCGYARYWWSYDLGKRIEKVPFKRVWSGLLELFHPALLHLPFKNMQHRLTFLQTLFRSNSWEEIYETMLATYRDDLHYLGLSYHKKEEPFFASGESVHPMQGMMLWDFHRYLPDDILVKVDRATMANSIEGREPMLDHHIVEYAMKLPFSMKYHNKESKYILKKILERYLPKELIYRKKMGFGIPMFEWFGGELVGLFEEYFKEDDDIIDMEYPRRLLQELKTKKYVNINKLWFVLVYRMWRRRYG